MHNSQVHRYITTQQCENKYPNRGQSCVPNEQSQPKQRRVLFVFLSKTTSNAFHSHKNVHTTTATHIKLHNERFNNNDDKQGDQGAVGIARAEFKKCGGVWSRHERSIRHCHIDLQSTQRQANDIG